MINIGIVGAAGYTGGELLRILIHHPSVAIAWAHSKSQAGKPIYATHTDLLGDTELAFSGEEIADLLDQENLNAIFLCSGHNESKKFLENNTVPASVKIIDLSTDFRDQSNGFVYGLPELQRERIKTADRIANPGCFATSIELALLPLAAEGLLTDEVHVSAVTGSTGAGQALSTTTHFSWRNNNISIYKAFTHQHLKEIKMSLAALQAGFSKEVNFIPYRGDFARGIMANVYTKYSGTLEEALSLYQTYYESHPFTHVSTQDIDLKQVINTNKCLIQLQKHGENLLITSEIDNLTKGASGQAVQNLNLLFGLPEDAGLRLKAAAF
ncbi:N-acetyl-gamma-glutamyl-phosphate reductase [Runella slithyformis]|uniref:N-acetyl-gamma-glutamyl-phosphate reductase n=1 Tax=Runella slithyformis (strain ATCC 29530 / DSM 19594 / LMG 11500 / NCIMB 11436 / LSU 4) TaxID=761193 RepID=A0A7U3ZPK0_RUNSL|nr:N-acetyl-gamma-glutamyl-phosphate reductase [Runella slithyformis]AEI50963.1 N-acetyl-gamma-glutamyl-phosphate reductase [Runella slithyformis DSM 19594]